MLEKQGTASAIVICQQIVLSFTAKIGLQHYLQFISYVTESSWYVGHHF